MSTNKSNKPELRFKGFSDDWEQRKLSECAGFRRGSFPQPYGNKEWYDGEEAMPFVQVADVADDMKLVDDTKQKISKLAQPMSVFADKGSVLVTLQGSIGRVAITQYGAFVDRTVLIFDKYNQNIDKTFWAYIIKKKFIDEAQKAPGGTIKTITKEALSDFDLVLPCFDEQKKLGAFLVSIDNLITLHQRKCENLKIIKKSMLDNLFPKNGEKVPKWRFKGFNNDWEQRKLGEFFKKYQNTVYLQDEEEYRQISIRNTGVVEYRCTNKGKNIGRKRQYLIDTYTHPVTLTFTRQTVYEGGIGFVPKELNGAIVTENMPLLEMTNASQDFMKALFNTNGYYKSVINDDTLIGSAQKALQEKQWLDSYVCIPVLDEQKQIGSFFQQLDNLITLHQSEVERLKKAKQFFLDKMFI